MGKVNIKIEKADLIALKQDKTTSAEFLQKYLSDKFSGTFKQICEELQAYYKDEGGSPLVPKFEIVPADCSFDDASGRGKVRLKYAVQYHFGCSDLNPVTDIAETCDFFVDEESCTLSVFIPDKVERSTVDEF
ncbi:MAG TPA: hypothetical protein DIT07_13660 [Sphingobacteriaceae bacterium]|nr:hypothetical protein [Sphingobacteriaceae bacterium]